MIFAFLKKWVGSPCGTNKKGLLQKIGSPAITHNGLGLHDVFLLGVSETKLSTYHRTLLDAQMVMLPLQPPIKKYSCSPCYKPFFFPPTLFHFVFYVSVKTCVRHSLFYFFFCQTLIMQNSTGHYYCQFLCQIVSF